jgi:hypothetical protein
MSDRFDNDPYAPLIDQAASAYGVDPSIIRAILHRESAGNPNAVSSAGAGGLMQLMPATAAGLGVTDRFDPGQNIDAGTRYYREMLDRFGGDPQLALAAYNAGPGRVDKHLATGAPLPAETRAYVPAVLARAGQGAAKPVDPLSLLPEDAVLIGGDSEADPLASLPPDAVLIEDGAKPAKPAENPSFASVRRGFSRFKQGAAGVAADVGLLTPETAAKTIAEEQRYQQRIAAPQETQDAMRRMNEAGSVAEFLSALYEQPGALLTIMGESLGQGGPGMAVGALGSVGGPIGFGAAQGVASGATEYASSVLQSLGDAGVDLTDPKSVQAGLSDPERMAAAREFALKRGVPVGLFDGLSAGLAGKIMRLAGGPQTVRGAVGRGVGEMGLQAGAGAAGEAGAQLASEGEISKPGAVALEGVAEIPGGVVETGIGARMHGRAREEAPVRVDEEASPESEQPLALPAPRTQGEGFVMGDQPEVREAQADVQRWSGELDAVQDALSTAKTPEERDALVERWTAARDGYTAARNRIDNLMPQQAEPEGVQPPPTSEPLPPRNLPDIYRSATADDPAMAALPPDAVLLDDAGRPAQIGMTRPAGLLEAPRRQGRYTPEMAQREAPAAAGPQASRANVAEMPALPAPASTAANRFMDERARQAAGLRQLTDRGAQEVETTPRGRDETTQPMPAEAPATVATAEQPATPQPGDRVRVTNAKTGKSYEATLTGERGPRTLVTRDDGKKLQPLTSAHSIERVGAPESPDAPEVSSVASPESAGSAPADLGPTLPPKQSRINQSAPSQADLEASLRRADETRNRPRLTPEQSRAAADAKAETLRKFDEAAATQGAEWKARFNAERDAGAVGLKHLKEVEYKTGWDDALRGARTIDPVHAEDFARGVRDAQAWLAANPRPEGPDSISITARTSRGRETKYTLPADADTIRAVRNNIDKLPIDRFRLTDEAERAMPAVEADLRARLKRYGIDDRVGFRLVDAIRNRQTGEAIPGALGRYGRRVIEVATAARDRAATLDHESIHAMRELGLFTQKEWDALKAAAERDDGVKLASVRRRYRNMGLDEESLYEEAVADLFADWQAGRRDAGTVQALLERIRDFLAAVAQAFRGQGFTTAESVFRSIDEGRIGKRGAQEQSVGAVAEAFEKQQRPAEGKSATDDRFALSASEQALADAILADRPGFAERAKKALFGNRSGIGSEAVRQFVNQFEPIFQAEMRAEKAAGRQAKLRDARVSAAKMTEMAVQDSGRLESMLVNGPLKWNAKEGIVETAPGIGGLLDIFKPLKNADDYRRFNLYAIARRAKRLKAEGRENLLSDAQIAEGLRLETPEFRQVFDGYQRFNKAMLDFAVDTGVVKASARDVYAGSMDYVPFYRVAEETGELPPPATLAKLSNPDPKIRKLEGGTDKIGDLAENVIRNATALAKAGMRNEAMRRIHGVLTEIGEVRNLTSADEKAGSVAFFDKGAKRHFVAEDPAMMAAMAGLRPEQQAGVYKALANFSNILRRGVTASPGFMLANLIRDTAGAWVQTGNSLSMTNNTLTGLVRAAKKADSVKELKTIAGVGGYEFGHGAGDMAAEMKRRLGVEVATTPGAIINKVLRPLEEVGSWTELANRDAIYRNLLEKGESRAEAAYQALNLINFSRKGANQSLRFMLPLVPFLNARIQGLYRMAETQGDPKALKGVLARGLLLTGVSAALFAAFGDDDAYKDAPIERRLNYYIVPVGDSKVLIPKPFEFGAIFSTLPEFLLDAIRKEDGDDLAKATAMTFLNTFSFNPIPQAVRPALEVYTNYDFFTGRPVEGQREQKLAPGERANAQTNATLKALGREANISPMKAEQLIGGYLGTLGQMALAGMDAVLGASGAVPSKPAGAFGSVPVVSPMIESAFGRFYKEGPDAANRWVGDFYELKRKSEETWNTIRKLREEGEVERAREMQRDNAGLVAARKQLSRMGDQIGDLSRRINDIRADDEMTPEEKRQRMDVLIARRNAIARRTATIVEKIKQRRSEAA